MPNYYDAVLALIPLALVGITGMLHLGGVVLTGAVAAAGVVTLGVIGHALFVNAPVEDVASPSRAD